MEFHSFLSKDKKTIPKCLGPLQIFQFPLVSFLTFNFHFLLLKILILELTKIWIADIAFVDRADIKAYVGPPTLQARYEILRSCLQELLRTGILTTVEVHKHLIIAALALLLGALDSG